MKVWHITRDTPPEVALQYAYGPHHFVEVGQGLKLAGAPLRPADILVDIGCAFGHGSQAVVQAVGLASGAVRIHVDHNEAFKDAAAACGALFMTLDQLTSTVRAEQGQMVIVVASHIANQANKYDTPEYRIYLDDCLKKLHDWMVEQTSRNARVFVIALEPGYSEARPAEYLASINPQAWVAQRSWHASPANQSSPGGYAKSFVVTELRNPNPIRRNTISLSDLEAKIEELPMGFGQVFHDPIPVKPFRIDRQATNDRTHDIYCLDHDDVEEYTDGMVARREAYEARVSHDLDMLGAFGDEW